VSNGPWLDDARFARLLRILELLALVP